VTVGVPTATTTTTITMHPAMASAAGTAFLATNVHPGTCAPLSTVATFSTYAIPACSPYANHSLRARPALARPTCEAVRQPICANSTGVHIGTSAGFAAGTIVGTPAAGIIGRFASDGHYKHARWSSHAGTITVMNAPFVTA